LFGWVFFFFFFLGMFVTEDFASGPERNSVILINLLFGLELPIKGGLLQRSVGDWSVDGLRRERT
jgi:hypothetical protein